MAGILRSVMGGLDRIVSRASLRYRREKPSLISLLFHTVADDAREFAGGNLDPQQATTLGFLRQSIATMLESGYRFVSPAEVSAGLRPEGFHVLLTFDDGYHNNVRLLPVLREFQVPCAFYISTGHVLDQRSFWWDALYRERKKRGAADSAIEKERKILKPMTHDRIEDHLAREFGSAAMKPVGDLDRPFTPAELRDFARDPLVHLGNHTADHAILVNYDEAGVRAQMSKAQEDLAGMTGTAPRTVSYPNGNSNPMVRRVARELGFDLGIGLEYRKNPLPMDPNSAMDIGRFLPWGDAPFEAQWEVFRSDFVPGNLLRRRFKKGY